MIKVILMGQVEICHYLYLFKESLAMPLPLKEQNKIDFWKEIINQNKQFDISDIIKPSLNRLDDENKLLKKITKNCSISFLILDRHRKDIEKYAKQHRVINYYKKTGKRICRGQLSKIKKA